MVVNTDASNFCALCAVGEVIVESCDTNDLKKTTTLSLKEIHSIVHLT